MMYFTLGEHANQYTTNAVYNKIRLTQTGGAISLVTIFTATIKVVWSVYTISILITIVLSQSTFIYFSRQTFLSCIKLGTWYA